MKIVSFSRSSALLSWLLWILVVLVLLLPSPTAQSNPISAVWQSPFDPIPGIGLSLQWRWCQIWGKFRQQIAFTHQRLRLAARLLACRSLAEVLQVLTRRQVVRYLGALPVLVALLERLHVRQIINRSCPTRSPVDHGAVALVLVLNRLMAPRPLYALVDWLATTWISEQLGYAPDKFNDDRLGRTLDVLQAHREEIWTEIQQQALRLYSIDLSVLFYDLTALVMTGAYPDSQLVDYGFANNTPKADPKLKLGVVLSRSGGLPWLFQAWSGRTPDQGTVQPNLEQLQVFLGAQGWSPSQVLVVGDSANLSSELAFAFAEANLHYLAGLPKKESVHRQLIEGPAARDFRSLELAPGYGGVPVAVPFTQGGRTLIHRGLVVRSEPLTQQFHQERAKQVRALVGALQRIQTKIGQKRYRTPVELQRRVATQLGHSPAAAFVRVEVVSGEDQPLGLNWWIDANTLEAAERKTGRFLLVTNDPGLSYPDMLALYRDKDRLEKRFEVVKQDLLTRPFRVHSDERIQALLLVNLIALLAYSLLEYQAQQVGGCLTTRRILEKLSSLQMQATESWDGSWAFTCQETRAGQVALLSALLRTLDPASREPLPIGRQRHRLLPERLPLQGGWGSAAGKNRRMPDLA